MREGLCVLANRIAVVAQTLVVRTKYTDFTGNLILMHCYILDHENMGMTIRFAIRLRPNSATTSAARFAYGGGMHPVGCTMSSRTARAAQAPTPSGATRKTKLQNTLFTAPPLIQ
jgi:hypothetical protein